MKKILIMLSALLLCSCANDETKTYIHLVGDEFSSREMASGEDVVVPYTEQAGVKFIDVMINDGIKCKMIVDSGCSDMLISIDEAKYLYKQGLLTDSDYIGTSLGQIADGSIVQDMKFNLKSVLIGGKLEFTNIETFVSENCDAPLLLGNSILDKFAKYTIDSEKKVIIFTKN